jgi:predicted dehydrogenase
MGRAHGTPLRIGLIGCGHWGRHVLRDLRLCGCDVDVVAVSPDSADNARQGGASRVVPKIADLTYVDGVVVVTPATTHVDIIDHVLSRFPGIPIYTEKPLTTDPKLAWRMAETHGAHVFVMHKWRYHPGVLALAEIARSGELGAVVGLRVIREQWGFRRRDVDAVWTHWPHVLSIVLEVLGEIPPPLGAGIDRAGDDLTGMTGFLGARPWVTVHDSVRSRASRREVQLHCDGGLASLGDSYADVIEVVRTGGLDTMNGSPEPERRAISTKLPLLAQLEAFLEFVRGRGPAPKGTIAEDAAIVETVARLRSLGNAN